MADVPSAATLYASYPEFSGADADLVNAKLAEAARRTNATVYGTAALAQDAVLLRAAELLILSPYGREMRSENPDQWLAWQVVLRKLQREATMGLRVF